MLTWTPTEWGTAASMVVGAYYAGRLLFMFVVALIGFERHPWVIEVRLNICGDADETP